MMAFLGLKHRETFLKNYLYPLIKDELVIMRLPDKPRSPKQKYVMTKAGEALLKKQK
jgi:ATP-dependent DNA helicase RecG